MSFYLRLSIAWLCLLAFMFIVPSCATPAFASGPQAVVDASGVGGNFCAPRVAAKAGELAEAGRAWQERRACAGEATASCYERLGEHATGAALTDCMAPLIEHCELAFRRVCGPAVQVAHR